MSEWVFETGDERLRFSDSMTGLGLMSEPEVSFDTSSEMVNLPRRDSRRPGVDTVHGQIVTLQVEVRADDRPLEAVWAELVRVWRGDAVRREPGRVASLMADSGVRAFGRPRALKPDMSRRLFGVIRAELEFECVDDLWYGPSSSTRVRFSVPESGGLMFPAEAPFTFDSGPTADNGTIRVEGDVPSFPVFEIHGPVRDPAVDVKGVGELIFEVSLAHDQVLRVDCGAGVVRRDGAPLPGALSTRGARLSDMRLAPGSYSVVLRGYDPTGTGELSVQVAPAFTSFVGGRS